MSDTTSEFEFTDQELDIIRSTLVQCYGHAVEIDLADAEMQLDSESDNLTVCPTVYWTAQGCHFVVCKTGNQRFYCQFFYDQDEMFSTGRLYYDDVFEATASMLKLQSEHALKRREHLNEGVPS